MKRVEFGQRQGTINAAMCLSKNEPWRAKLDREYLHHVALPPMKSKNAKTDSCRVRGTKILNLAHALCTAMVNSLLSTTISVSSICLAVNRAHRIPNDEPKER